MANAMASVGSSRSQSSLQHFSKDEIIAAQYWICRFRSVWHRLCPCWASSPGNSHALHPPSTSVLRLVPQLYRVCAACRTYMLPGPRRPSRRPCPFAGVLLFAAVPVTVADPAAPSHMLCCVSAAVLFVVCPRTGMQRWQITRRAAADDEARAGADGDVDKHVHSLLADLNTHVLTQIDASTYGPAGQRRVQMPVEESCGPSHEWGDHVTAHILLRMRHTPGFFFRQLTHGFKASNSLYYTEYFHLLESLSTINSVVLVYNLPNVDELMIKIFRDLFQLV
ncbi:hypothetical protein B0H14DRAFT_2595775 [Mycena olivaceomarginata]|nr:hypothetical protein B0H14DRAFT_2595775 [Mycena olivaceomarginata]